MKPFVRIEAVAAPLELADIDTDKIFPSRFGKRIRTPESDYGQYLFYDMRYDAEGREVGEFVLNQPAYREAAILVTGPNFGCGSSREAAVYALVDSGIRSVIAPSFGDIHYANQIQNGMLPIVLPEAVCKALCSELRERPGSKIAIDLAAQSVTAPGGTVHRFEIDAVYRQRLLQGLDEIEMILEHRSAIETFEKAYREEMSWLVTRPAG